MSYSRKQITRWVKFLSRKFGRMVPTLLKRCYQATTIWYSKLAPTRWNCFIACDCVRSQPDNPYLMYKSGCKNGNLIRKWALNTMIWMLEHGNVTMKSQFSTPRTIIWRHSIHPEVDLDPIGQLKKRGTHQEPDEIVPQKFYPKRRN